MVNKLLKLSVIVTVAFIFFMLNSCNGPTDSISGRLSSAYSDESYKLYESAIIELTTWVESQQPYYPDTHSYIFKNTLFRDLYFNPRKHFIYAEKFITKPQIKFHAKKIAIRTLQCLPIEDYVALGKSIIKLNDIDLFESYMSPSPEYGFIIDEHYSHKAVKALLDEFQIKYPQIDISLTTSGETKGRYMELKAFGEALPVLDCNAKP